MNAIAKALADIKVKIPQGILREGFLSQGRGGGYGNVRLPVSLDHRIQQEVIQGRVIPDCNLVGGVETKIPLASVAPQYLPDDPYKMIYQIPKSLTNGRSITQVYSIQYGQGGAPVSFSAQHQGSGAMTQAAQGLLAANSPIPSVNNAYVRLIGENVVMVEGELNPSPYVFLHCLVESDESFSHLKPTSILTFSKLCVLATKGYLYNNLSLPIDTAQLIGGMPLGRFREIIDGYADADEMYDELFETRWIKIMKMNDPMFLQRHLKGITGGQY